MTCGRCKPDSRIKGFAGSVVPEECLGSLSYWSQFSIREFCLPWLIELQCVVVRSKQSDWYVISCS
jgi:hypothetical protein